MRSICTLASALRLQPYRLLLAGILATVLHAWAAMAQATAEPAAASFPPPLRSEPAFVPSKFQTFAEWKAACDRLPSYRKLTQGLPPPETLPLRRYSDVQEVLSAFLKLSATGTLSDTNLWVGHAPLRSEFFNTNRLYVTGGIPFQPFAQKLVLPPDSQVLFHGDMHGDVRSLVRWMDALNEQKILDGFRIREPHVYMVFLGDYTDRGWFGTEVLYTLLRLKLANPNQVVLLRGNHEDEALVKSYGFLAETQAKYGPKVRPEPILRMFDFFPVVLYLGTGNDFIQCNHGGMEPGFDPGTLLDAAGSVGFQLLGSLNQARFKTLQTRWFGQVEASSRRVAETYLRDFTPATPTAPITLGFMWNDFTIAPGEPQLGYDAGRAFVYGDRLTRVVLETAGTSSKQVRAVFRAHQHSSVLNPMMARLKASRGVFRHWQANDSTAALSMPEARLRGILDQSMERSIPPYSVWTFNVSPDSVYGNGCRFDFDSSGILKLGRRFEDWRLQVLNVTVPLD